MSPYLQKILTCDMERHQSHGIAIITWFCEAPLPSICRHPPPREGDTRGGPYPGGRTRALAPSSGSPRTLDRGRYLHGEGACAPVTLGFNIPVSPVQGRVERNCKGREEGQTHPRGSLEVCKSRHSSVGGRDRVEQSSLQKRREFSGARGSPGPGSQIFKCGYTLLKRRVCGEELHQGVSREGRDDEEGVCALHLLLLLGRYVVHPSADLRER